MKLLHTGDLHIGKKIHEVSLWEDQEYMLQQIYDIAVEKQVDAVLLAGDIYDRSVPGTEAVELPGRPTGLLPSPPPWGWSQGFMTEPRTVGRTPMWRLRPALPM